MVFREEMKGLLDEVEKFATTLETAASRVGDDHVARGLRRRASEANTFIEAMRPWLKTELAASYLIA